MKKSRWIEIIGVRLFSPQNSKAVKKIFRELSEGLPAASGKPVSPELYANNIIGSDWSIHLNRQQDSGMPEKTRLGLGIAAAFNDLGLVHHSVWAMKPIQKEQSI